MPLYFSFDFPPNDGGIAKLGERLCAELKRHGVELAILTAKARGVAAVSGPEVRVSSSRLHRELQAYSWLRARRNLGTVICGTWYPEGLLALLAGARPLVILAHGLELMPTKAYWRRKFWRKLLRTVCESAQLVVANSEYTRRLLLRTAPNARVVAVPLGVDQGQFSPQGREAARNKFGVEGKLTVLSVARLYEYKGLDTVIKALAELPRTTREQFIYLVAGRGPHEAALRAAASRLGVSAQIRWLGFVSEDDLPDLYRASDLFVLCTREAATQQEVDGFGLVFLEAQASGTPVVGTRSGGIPEALREKEGGWLIEEGNAHRLASLLLLLADHPEVFRAAGRAARERVERECTWTHYVHRFVSEARAEGIEFVRIQG